MENPKPNELRRGNYIKYLDELYVVTGIKEEGAERRIRVYFSTLDGKIKNAKTLNWIEAISLTPEIINMCGEIVTHSNSIKELAIPSLPIYLALLISGNHLCLSYRGNIWIDLQSRINSLHKLQNITYDLSEKELSINW